MWNKYITTLSSTDKKSGFTLVELLIVVVIVAVLAALTTTVYASVSGRSADSVVQNDLTEIAKKLKMYQAENGVYPITAQLPSLGLRVSKSAYGSHYNNGSTNYNFVYCRMPATAPTEFALVAFSRSGNGYQYSSGGQLGRYTGLKTGSVAMCGGAGIAMSGFPSERDWFFDADAWQSYVGG